MKHNNSFDAPRGTKWPKSSHSIRRHNTYELVSDGSWPDDADHADDMDKLKMDTSPSDHPPQSSSMSCTSNEALLSTAFISFMAFTILQTAAAFVAQSEAMLGDSAAMFVDALTYAFNLHAERRKNAAAALPLPSRSDYPSDQAHATAIQEQRLSKRRSKLRMELLPPLLSVVTLVLVIAFVLHQALRVLLLDVHRSVEQQSKPNLILMLSFSLLNLSLDALNVFCFARAKHACGFPTDSDGDGDGGDDEEHANNDARATCDAPRDTQWLPTTKSNTPAPIPETEMESLYTESSSSEPSVTLDQSTRNKNVSSTNNGHDAAAAAEQEQDHHSSQEGPNLNMCSAYTHVFADTLRSIAVVVAAVTAEMANGVTPEEADASAAIVVSIVILLSLLPLLNGLRHTWKALRHLEAEMGVACVTVGSEIEMNESPTLSPDSQQTLLVVGGGD